MLKVNFSDSADIISGDILVHNEDLQDSGSPCVSWDSNVNGFVPDDWGFFFSLDNSGSELLSSSFGVESENDVVFHGTQDIVAFLEETCFDVEGKS